MRRTWPLIAATLIALTAAFLVPAVPQPAAYHQFADQRQMFGIGHFLDVISNAGFLLVGLGGLWAVLNSRRAFQHRGERWPYALFFLGVALTAAGSSYYHLAPNNERLVWDRLPMTIAFTSLIAAQVCDRISIRAGLALLAPLLLAGIGSVGYWIASERAGAGNLVPYAVLQAYAVVVLLLLARLYPSRYTRGNDIYWVLAAYLAAKLLETLDRPVLAFTDLVSGHTLKHLAAAVAALIILRMLLLRRPRSFDANEDELNRRAGQVGKGSQRSLRPTH
jgi:hypothetical protein